MSDLESCPFCGSKTAPKVLTAVEIDQDVNAPDFAVCCQLDKRGCGATGCYALSPKEAIAKWNRRAPQ